jgi:tripartite-type tricarboxylate transporter receptor subunit TctC
MNPEAVAYYTEMFRKLSETPEWTTYTSEQALIGDFLSGDDLQAYFLAERAVHADLLAAMGEGS